jgi:hypothetical protein
MKKTLIAVATVVTMLFTSCEKKISCTDFKSGKFLISNDTIFEGASVLYKTENSQQQITSKGDTLFAKVEWINDCSYKLTFNKNKMYLSAFQIDVNTRGGILVEFGIPNGNIMPYTSVLKGETKAEIFKGFLKKIN